jgi:hypothetical protein
MWCRRCCCCPSLKGRQASAATAADGALYACDAAMPLPHHSPPPPLPLARPPARQDHKPACVATSSQELAVTWKVTDSPVTVTSLNKFKKKVAAAVVQVGAVSGCCLVRTVLLVEPHCAFWWRHSIRELMQLAYSSTIDAQCMLHFIFDSMSELNHHIGLAAGPDGTCE